MSPSPLHKALESLRPKDWSDFPLDSLDTFLPSIWRDAELIANSVPPPPGGTDFSSSRRALQTPNSAHSASEMTVSQARPPLPDPEQEKLREAWGKPLKLSASQNPLQIAVYKMAGHDRHGAWFARRSVHEGLGFEKWRKAMKMEFPESLAVQGGPGEGNVRGIGGDRKVESHEVKGMGRVEVYQLSAQFPGPTTPREFLTGLITSSNALTEASAPHINGQKPNKSQIPRHFMVVSIPVSHPDAPPRQGLILGQYESVELIREIPLPSSSSKSASTSDLPQKASGEDTRPRGSTVNVMESKSDAGEDSNDDDRELNPVEWIMITRSDPGGGIPRFMVERGTPGSIAADASKFLDWACAKKEEDLEFADERAERVKVDEVPDLGHLAPRRSIDSARLSVVDTNAYLAGVGESIADKVRPQGFERRLSSRSVRKHELDTEDTTNSNLMSALRKAAETGIADYAPKSVSDTLLARRDSDDDSSSTYSSSADSFASAEQFTTAEEGDLLHPDAAANGPPITSSEALSLQSFEPSSSDVSKDPAGVSSPSKEQARYERELAKIEKQKKDLADKLQKERERDTKNASNASEKEAAAAQKAKEKHERHLRRQKDKYEKEMAKLAERKEKEEKRLRDRAQKEAEKNALARVQREREEYRQEVEVLRKENALLRETLGELQKENTALVARVGRTEEGRKALGRSKTDVASIFAEEEKRKRGTSVSSKESRKDKESIKSQGSEKSGKSGKEK